MLLLLPVSGIAHLPPSPLPLAGDIRGPLDPRIAGEMDGHVEVGDAANAAAERPDRTREDAIQAKIESTRPIWEIVPRAFSPSL